MTEQPQIIDSQQGELSSREGVGGEEILRNYLESRKADDKITFQAMTVKGVELGDPRMEDFKKALAHYLASSAIERKYQLIEWGLPPNLSPYLVYEGDSSLVAACATDGLWKMGKISNVAQGLLESLSS